MFPSPLWRLKQANKAESLLVLLLSVGGIGRSDCACPPGFSNPDGGPCKECTPGTYSGSSLANVTCSGNCPCTASNNISSGNIYDGPTNYGSNANCKWLISSSAVIEIVLTSLETQQCCDFVTINRCSSPSCSTTEQVARLSGSWVSGSSTYSSSTGYLQVVFTSDSGSNKSGFSASWKTTRSECLQCPAGKYSTSSQGTSETSCLPCPVLPQNANYSSENGIPCRKWTCKEGYVSNGTSCMSCPVLAVKGCLVGEYFDCTSGKGCTNCTNAPRGSKYITAGIPTTQNKCDWDCNGGGECPDAYEREWFMGPALSNSNVVIALMVVWAFILLSGISAICCCPDRKKEIIFVMRMVLYVMWFVFEFTFMCARFHWMLNSEDAKFETMSIKTENKEFIWKGPKFNVSSRTERVNAGCNFTDDLLEHAPEDACFLFNADIHFKGKDFYANAAKVMVGFGLLIYAIIKMVVLFIVEHFEGWDDDEQQMTAVHPMPPPRILSVSPSQRNEMTAETPIGVAPDGTDVGNGQGFFGKNLCLRAQKAIIKDLVVFLITIPISAQQCLVLLPFNSFNMSPVCGTLTVPGHSQDAACLYKWAIAGLPFGIPMTLAGFFFGRFISSKISEEMKRDGSGKVKVVWVIILMSAGLLAITFVIIGVCMILFWLFGGSAVGFWFTFGSWESLKDLTAARVMISPSTVMITALVTLFFD